MKKEIKYVECPKCFGTGVYYTPLEDVEKQCNLCKGKGKVSEEIADMYDPISDMLSDLGEIGEE